MKESQFLLLVLLSLSPLLLSTPLVVHAQWEPDVRLTFNDSTSYTSQSNARCVVASGDTVHVVWYDRRDGNWEIYYKRSIDAGMAWGPDTRLTTDSASSQNPSIAVSGSNVHLVWQDRRDGNWEIYYKRSPDGGSTWNADIRLTADTMASCTPSISVLDSMVHVVWHSNWSGTSNKVSYKRSTDGGVSWSPDSCLMRSQSFFNQSMGPSIGSWGSSVHLVFREGPDTTRIIYMRSSDRGFTWSPCTVLASYILPPDVEMWYSVPSLAVADSLVHVVYLYNIFSGAYGWEYSLEYRRSLDGGSTWSDRGWLCGRNLAAFPRDLTAGGCASGLNVHVVWFDFLDRNEEIYYRGSYDRGTTWGPEMRLTHDGASSMYPSIEAQGSKVHVVWAEYQDGNYEIYYKRNPTGNSGVEESTSSAPISHFPFSICPNPFVSFSSVPGHERDRFALYDISGRRVGTYRGDRIGEGLRAGVYFVRALEGKAGPVRIVKVR